MKFMSQKYFYIHFWVVKYALFFARFTFLDLKIVEPIRFIVKTSLNHSIAFVYEHNFLELSIFANLNKTMIIDE